MRIITARIMTLITGFAMIVGLIILGGCAPELQRTNSAWIDDNGNLSTMECVGECLSEDFTEIVPASAQ